jgi:hypothetical protein
MLNQPNPIRDENRYYDLTPRVVPANRESTINITPLFEHGHFTDGVEYDVEYLPSEHHYDSNGRSEPRHFSVRAGEGRLCFSRYFHEEQEHVLLVREKGKEKPPRDFRVYSVREDLFARRPFKGDFHLHSCRSDGVESPAYVAGACRRIGMDFMAVSDHYSYEPSLEAARAFEGVDVDLRIYPGEEVHPPANPVHMIHFGGRFSVNALFGDEAAHREAVRSVQETLKDLPAGADPYICASALWTLDKIREAGGLAVFCHPYWMPGRQYSPPMPVTDFLFERLPFDAFELLGGAYPDELYMNKLQVARWSEERARRRKIPVLGLSDSHGCEKDLFGWVYTIVFSPGLEVGELISSVKDCWSVAVEALPGETVRAYGPFRLVKYALFLLREVLPRHDALCAEEGSLMLRHLAGDPAAAPALSVLKGRVRDFYGRCWKG